MRKPNNQVVIRVRWEGKRYEANFIPGIYADPAKWDVQKKKAKNGYTHHVGNKKFTSADINGIIADYEAEIDQTFVEFGADNKVSTELEFKAVVNERLETQDIEMEKWNKNQYRSQIITMLDSLSSDQLQEAVEMLKKIAF